MRLGIVAIGFATFGASRAEATSYGGEANGAKITVPTTGTVIRAASGVAPISGGGEEAALLVGDVPGSVTGGAAALAAGVMRSSIVGSDATRGEASMANVTLTVSGNQISSNFLMARGTASCGPAANGSSQLSNLVINGQAINVTGNPNQTVALPNGTAIINQQTPSTSGTTARMIVNALHVTTTDSITHQALADVILANVDAQIDCSGGPPASTPFGTGGGWVLSNDGLSHLNFGVVGGIQPNGSKRGHVLVHDQATGFKLQSTQITDVTSDACTTTIYGVGNTSSPSASGVEFKVTINDAGEPGAPLDSFKVELAYDNAFIQLEGGNIQAHNPACP